jgi:hypothetical protein
MEAHNRLVLDVSPNVVSIASIRVLNSSHKKNLTGLSTLLIMHLMVYLILIHGTPSLHSTDYSCRLVAHIPLDVELTASITVSNSSHKKKLTCLSIPMIVHLMGPVALRHRIPSATALTATETFHLLD